MKYSLAPLFWLLCLPLQADFTATPVPFHERTLGPNGLTGQLFIDGYYGTGELVGSNQTVLTAAHVVYDDRLGKWATSGHWATDGDSIGATLRSFRYLADYSTQVAAHGSDTPQAFALDLAVGASYTPVGTEGKFARLPPGGGESLISSSRRKQIIGYPVDYTGRYHNSWSLQCRTGPFPTAFTRVLNAFHTLRGVGHGGGGSGGGVWVEQDDGSWELAAVYVSGIDRWAGGDFNLVGVVALDGEASALIEQSVEAVQQATPRFASVVPQFDLHWEQQETLEVRFAAGDAPTVEWYLFRPDVGYSEVVDPSLYESGTDFSRLDPWSDIGRFYGSQVKLRVGNEFTVAETDWIPLEFVDAGLPVFSQQPRDLRVNEGEPVRFSAAVEGFPPVTEFEWQVAHDSSLEWGVDLEMVAPHYTSDRRELDLTGEALRWDGGYYRVRAVNVLGTSYSEWASLEVVPKPIAGRLNSEEQLDLTEGEIARLAFSSEGDQTGHIWWEYRAPRAEARWQAISSDQSVPGIRLLGDQLEIRPQPGASLHGYEVRVVWERRIDPYGGGSFDVDAVTLPVKLRQSGPPVLEARLRPQSTETGEAFRADFVGSSGLEAEWQWLDADAQVWRPIPATFADMSVDEFGSTIHLHNGHGGVRVRMVLRAAGYPAQITEATASRISQTSEQQLSFDDLFDEYSPGAQASGELLVVSGGPWNQQRFVTFSRVDGKWRREPGVLTAPADLVEGSFGVTYSLEDNRLYVGAPLAPALDADHTPGVIIVYRWESGGWVEEQRLGLRQEDVGPLGTPFGRRFSITGDFLVSGHFPAKEGTLVSVLQRDAGGSWRYLDRIEATSDVAACLHGGSSFGGALAFGDYLFIGSQGPHGAPAVAFEVSGEALALVDCEGLDFVPRLHIGEWLIGSNHVAGLGPVLFRVGWTPEAGVHDIWWYTVNLNHLTKGVAAATALVWDHRGRLAAELYALDPVTGGLGPPMSFVPESPHLLELKLALPTEDGFAVISRRSTGGHQIDFVRGHALPVDEEDGSQLPWLKVEHDSEAPGMLRAAYRAATASEGPSAHLLWSRDLSTWTEADAGDVKVAHPDWDGDGATELREVRLPLPADGAPLFFRAVEREQPR